MSPIYTKPYCFPMFAPIETETNGSSFNTGLCFFAPFSESVASCWLSFYLFKITEKGRYVVNNLNGNTNYYDSHASSSFDSITTLDIIILSKLKQIIGRGHDAEVRRTSDGGMKIFEIVKTIVFK